MRNDGGTKVSGYKQVRRKGQVLALRWWEIHTSKLVFTEDIRNFVLAISRV